MSNPNPSDSDSEDEDFVPAPGSDTVAFIVNNWLIYSTKKDEEEEEDSNIVKQKESDNNENSKKRNLKKLADDIWEEMNSPNKKQKTTEISLIENTPTTPTKPTAPISTTSPGSRFAFSKCDSLLKEAQKAKEIATKTDSEIKLGSNVNLEKKIYDFAGEKVE